MILSRHQTALPFSSDEYRMKEQQILIAEIKLADENLFPSLPQLEDKGSACDTPSNRCATVSEIHLANVYPPISQPLI